MVSKQVVTYSWAYDARRKMDLCAEHAAHPPADLPSIGQVLHGAHLGECDVCHQHESRREA